MTEPATTSEAAATSPGPERSTRLATAAQIAGIIGIVVCIAIVVATWLGRGALTSAVDDLAASVNSGFVRAISATGQVSDRLDAAGTQAAEIATEARNLVAGQAPPDSGTGLAGRVAQLADTYRTLRERFDQVRENVGTAIASVQRIARFVPGVEAPSGPPPKVQAIDDKLQSIDDRITAMAGSFGAGAPTGQNAQALADGAAAVQSAISDASANAQGLSADLDAARARAVGVVNDLGTIVTIGAAAITVLFIWVFILNIGLWQLGRAWKREAARER
jgi:hypothetical protein